MPRLKFRDFRRGWWPQGARDAVPQNTLRRATGIAQTKTTALQSRWGSTLIAALDAHSVHKFADFRFQGVGTDYYRDGTTIIKTGLDGTKLTMARMPPTVDKTDWAFVAGGGALFKVDPDGAAWIWGIAAPPDGFTATANTQRTKEVDDFDSAAGWTAASCTLADEGTIKQEGTNAMKMTVAVSTVGTATKAITIDLSGYTSPTLTSPDEDWIVFWLRIDYPDNIRSIQLQFDLSGGSFNTDFFTRVLYTGIGVTPTGATTTTVGGVGSLPSISSNDGALSLTQTEGSRPVEVMYLNDGSQEYYTVWVQDQLGTTTIPAGTGQWTKMRVPKSTFQRSGTAAKDWDDVVAVRLTVTTNENGPAVVYWDQMVLGGGFGMQGTYQYHVVFRNSNSGSRSDPNPTPVEVANVERQSVALANLPLSSDPQVNQREIYRTLGNGVLFFRVGVIEDNTTTTYTDTATDVYGLDSTTTNIMSDIQMEEDNERPTDSWDDCEAMYAGRMWWARSPVEGERGRVFYSPSGRAESVESWIDVSSDDDPTQKIIIWNGALWCFTSSFLYQIVGTGPFTFRRVYGVPGTLWPLTVRVTPYGIAYLAHDGVRLFTGAASKLINSEACGLIFKQETLEGITFSED